MAVVAAEAVVVGSAGSDSSTGVCLLDRKPSMSQFELLTYFSEPPHGRTGVLELGLLLPAGGYTQLWLFRILQPQYRLLGGNGLRRLALEEHLNGHPDLECLR